VLTSDAATLERYPAISRCARLRRNRQTGTYVLLSPERGLKLNASAALVVRHCNGRLTVSEIVDALVDMVAQDDAERPRVAADVMELLAQLSRRGLVVLRDTP
jgi:pyrroloquinoline quinone biosynthesis protein D